MRRRRSRTAAPPSATASSPHLAAYAKAIGGGVTIGAFGGEARRHGVGRPRARRSRGRSTATRSSSAAGLAALTEVLTHGRVRPPGQARHAARRGLRAGDRRARPPGPHGGPGRQGLRVVPARSRCTNYRDFLETHPELFYASYPWMVNRGIFMTPGDEEQWTISVQHTEDDVQRYVDAFAGVLRRAGGPEPDRCTDSAPDGAAAIGARCQKMHRVQLGHRDASTEAIVGLRAPAHRAIRSRSTTRRPRTSSPRPPDPRSRPRASAEVRPCADLDGRARARRRITTDHPSLPRVRARRAPSKASVLFDLAVSARPRSIGAAGSEGAGRDVGGEPGAGWLAELAGMPAGSGGCFVSGGTAGNLRLCRGAATQPPRRRGGERPARWQIACADTVHSSGRIGGGVGDGRRPALRPHDERGRLTGSRRSRRRWIDADPSASVRGQSPRARLDRTPASIDDLDGHRDRVSRAGLWLPRRRAPTGGGAPCRA